MVVHGQKAALFETRRTNKQPLKFAVGDSQVIAKVWMAFVMTGYLVPRAFSRGIDSLIKACRNFPVKIKPVRLCFGVSCVLSRLKRRDQGAKHNMT